MSQRGHSGIETVQGCADRRGDGDLEDLILGWSGGAKVVDVAVGDRVGGVADRRRVSLPRFGKRVAGRGGETQGGAVVAGRCNT
ncbi:hypothetical protein [Rhodococcus opacus]|uniref:hypothetical protein n=1 Tax=Rhodococcus opacus TaxID=37919 RepID=UPI001F5484FC|nr:hypothetical protein [Rhodococcus opacus]